MKWSDMDPLGRVAFCMAGAVMVLAVLAAAG